MLRQKKRIKGIYKKEKKEEPASATNFKTLSPIKNADIEIYEDALTFAFSNNEIRNVAITGAYCSGKSSIIETYEEKNKDKINLLHISLAHFCSISKAEILKLEETDDENDKSPNTRIRFKEKKRSTIESKLLNQLIHQIPSEKIKYSNFKTTRKPDIKRTFLLSTIFCVFIALLVYIIKFNTWGTNHEKIKYKAIKDFLEFTTFPEVRILSAVIVIAIIGCIAFKLIHAQYASSFIRKISFQGNEIEIGNGPKSSFLDKYLNEVLYIFSELDAQAIVFEDIDRFDDITLFERLREINTLVNIRRKQEKKHNEPLRFIYMMRDDIFNDFKDRTKFFDFIIPVIPILDGSNSYSVLKEYLTEDGLITYFDDHFLRQISLYIDDYRVLKNINNELLIFHKKLKAPDLDLNRLLAMLTYKNIFPHDYDELRFNRGCVYSFFDAEERIKNELKAPYKEREKLITEEIEKIDDNYRVSLEEVDKNSTKSEPMSLSKIGSTIDIQQNKNKLRREHDLAIKPLRDKLNEIQRKKTEIDTIPFYKLLSSNSESYFTYEYLKEKIKVPHEIIKDKYFGLLKFLLTSGYIDASYPDYMTYFYENGLSISDNYFIRAVLERNNQKYNYKIDNPKAIIKSLKPYYFSQPATLNYDLYDCVFSSRVDYKDQIFNVMSFFGSSRRVDYKDFIEGYLLSERNNDIFFELLLKTWEDIFVWVEDDFSAEALKKLSIMILKYSNDKALYNYQDSKLSEYLSSTPTVFSLEIDRNRLYSALSLLDVKFIDLKNEYIDSDALEYLYSKELYELNEGNISNLLIKKCNVNDINKLLKRFFAFVLRHKEYPLCLYIRNNIDIVIPVYLEMYSGEIEDDSDSACKVINLSYTASAEQYINRLKTTINNIERIDDVSLISLLFRRKRIDYNANNIVSWFGRSGKITPDLIEFIDSDDKTIAYDKNDQLTGDFLSAILKDNTIRNEKYCQIIQCLGDSVIDYIESSIPSENRVDLLLDSKILKYSAKATSCIKANYPNLLEKYISIYIDDYIQKESSELELEDFYLVLSSNLISEQKKIQLLEKHQISVSVINNNYSQGLTNYILEHNLHPKDAAFFTKNYSTLPDALKEKVVAFWVSDHKRFIKEVNSIDPELLSKLLSDERLDISSKVRVLSLILDDMESNEIEKVLLALGADKIANNISGGNKKVAVNETNRRIIRVLWEKHIIKYPHKTASGIYYKKLEYIDKSLRPRISPHNQIGINENRI